MLTALKGSQFYFYYRVTDKALVAETAVWPIPFLKYIVSALKELSFTFYSNVRIFAFRMQFLNSI